MKTSDRTRKIQAVLDLVAQADATYEGGLENGDDYQGDDGDPAEGADTAIIEPEPYDGQYNAHQVRLANYAGIALLEQEGLPQLASLVRRSLLRNEGNLTRGEHIEAIQEPRLATLDAVRESMAALSSLAAAPGNEAFDPSYLHALRILTNARGAASRLGRALTGEKDVDDICEAVLRPTFPDLDSNPTVNLATAYRQPDTEIPSISALIEYKFLDDKKKVSPILDEIQADVRNYASSGYKNLAFVVVQTDDFFVLEKLKRDVKREPTSFARLDVILWRS